MNNSNKTYSQGPGESLRNQRPLASTYIFRVYFFGHKVYQFYILPPFASRSDHHDSVASSASSHGVLPTELGTFFILGECGNTVVDLSMQQILVCSHRRGSVGATNSWEVLL